ncbi:hypothetical protein DXG03_007780 [Asterophora parasitica]|uniref:P-loop containing nucleoside triphosphate hydrolase protein n=1 Tax=Asterophora parasitica TaxID=117018 RepID=A0A9P7GDI5_9AGAR|nr:hypothetical protein DXG03_007780 [Asterophora parasitica]
MASFLLPTAQKAFCGILDSGTPQNLTVLHNATASASQAPTPTDLSSLLTFLFSFSALHDWLKLFVIGGILETCRRGFYASYNKFVNSFFISATFDENDDSYDWVMVWLSKKPAWAEARELQVSTRSFGLNSSAVLVPGEEEDASAMVKGSRKLAIMTRHHRFLNELLLEAKTEYMAAQQNSISIYVADSSNDWRNVATRPKRPLHSIVLDPGVKDLLIDDARDFLASKLWYTTRGIPFRRGYLLYGAPGSGKTSIIHSLAGELGLDVYIISLSRIGMDDTSLSQLTSELPEKCIALMEDIDAAFTQTLNRDDTTSVEQTDSPKSHEPPKSTSRVSLSGLLNALDGVGAQEGRILFATTNKYESLDPALCRPGRMDIHIEFKLASKFQARELYRCFYLPVGEEGAGDDNEDVPEKELVDSGDDSSESASLIDLEIPAEKPPVKSASTPPSPSSELVAARNSSHLDRAPKLSRPQVLQLAARFADAIPDRRFSMASLQGYLMGYKTRPFDAVKDVTSWVEKELSP